MTLKVQTFCITDNTVTATKKRETTNIVPGNMMKKIIRGLGNRTKFFCEAIDTNRESRIRGQAWVSHNIELKITK